MSPIRSLVLTQSGSPVRACRQSCVILGGGVQARVVILLLIVIVIIIVSNSNDIYF